MFFLPPRGESFPVLNERRFRCYRTTVLQPRLFRTFVEDRVYRSFSVERPPQHCVYPPRAMRTIASPLTNAFIPSARLVVAFCSPTPRHVVWGAPCRLCARRCHANVLGDTYYSQRDPLTKNRHETRTLKRGRNSFDFSVGLVYVLFFCRRVAGNFPSPARTVLDISKPPSVHRGCWKIGK